MEIIALIGAIIGILAGIVELFEFLNKKKKTINFIIKPKSRTHKSATTQIPRYLSSFVGREKEISEVKKILRSKESRLVTITGPGGVGKTRLAYEISDQLTEFFHDGIYVVHLSEEKNPEMVLPIISQSLGVSEVSELLVTQQIIDHIRKKHLLILLDNFEQIIGAASDIASLLSQSPYLRILITSREPLRINGEIEYLIQPFPVPSIDQFNSLETLEDYSSIQLFIERSHHVEKEELYLVAQICRKLEGLPLAIELTAARVKSLPLEKILNQLENPLDFLVNGQRDLPLRQRTLRSTVEWSFNLLSEEEQRLFICLSVFVGGFSYNAAEEVYLTSIDKKNNFSVYLASLIEKNLIIRKDIQTNDTRYYMLEIIRDCIQDISTRLNNHQNIQTTQFEESHAQYFYNLVCIGENQLSDNSQQKWMDVLDLEYGNIRTALNWFIDNNQQRKVLEYTGALGLYWIYRGYFQEGILWLERILSKDNREYKAALVKVLWIAASIFPTQGDFGKGKTLYNQSISISKELGDTENSAIAKNYLGNLYSRQGDYDQAKLLISEALKSYESANNIYQKPWAMLDLGHVEIYQGNLNQGFKLIKESFELFQANEDQRGMAAAYDGLSICSKYTNKIEDMKSYLNNSLHIYKELGDKLRIAITLTSLGESNLISNHISLAKDLTTQGFNLFSEINDQRGIGRACLILGEIYIKDNDYLKALFFIDKSSKIMKEIGDIKYNAKSLIAKGKLLAKQNKIQLAQESIITGIKLMKDIHAILSPYDKNELNQITHILDLALIEY